MKVVIDTNVLFSALYLPGSIPDQIVILGAQERLMLYAPDTVHREMARVMQAKLAPGPELAQRIQAGLPVTWIGFKDYEPFLGYAKAAIRDPDDASLVAVALLAGAPVVSGDRAFHPLERPLVETWTPRSFLEHLAKR